MTTFFILLVLWAVMISILGIIMIKMSVELYQQVKKQPIAVKEIIKPKRKYATKRISNPTRKV